MPFTKPIGTYLARISRHGETAERAMAGLGRLAAPAALFVAIVTGEMLARAAGLDGAVGFGAVRAMHHLAGIVLGALLLYRAAAFLNRGRCELRRRPVNSLWAGILRLPGGLTAEMWIEGSGWLVVGVLLISGLDRMLGYDWGWRPISAISSGAWIAIHAIAPPYLYACLLLAAYLRLRRIVPAVVDYMLRNR